MYTIKNYIMLAGLVACSTSALAQEEEVKEEGPSSLLALHENVWVKI